MLLMSDTTTATVCPQCHATALMKSTQGWVCINCGYTENPENPPSQPSIIRTGRPVVGQAQPAPARRLPVQPQPDPAASPQLRERSLLAQQFIRPVGGGPAPVPAPLAAPVPPIVEAVIPPVQPMPVPEPAPAVPEPTEPEPTLPAASINDSAQISRQFTRPQPDLGNQSAVLSPAVSEAVAPETTPSQAEPIPSQGIPQSPAPTQTIQAEASAQPAPEPATAELPVQPAVPAPEPAAPVVGPSLDQAVPPAPVQEPPEPIIEPEPPTPDEAPEDSLPQDKPDKALEESKPPVEEPSSQPAQPAPIPASQPKPVIAPKILPQPKPEKPLSVPAVKEPPKPVQSNPPEAELPSHESSARDPEPPPVDESKPRIIEPQAKPIQPTQTAPDWIVPETQLPKDPSSIDKFKEKLAENSQAAAIKQTTGLVKDFKNMYVAEQPKWIKKYLIWIGGGVVGIIVLYIVAMLLLTR